MDDRSAVVRKASPADAEAIAEVSVASRRWSYRGILSDATLDGLSVDGLSSHFARWLAQLDPDSAVFVAERAGRIVGYAIIEPSGGSDLPGGGAELDSLYVIEDVAGTGVGHVLMEAAVASARGKGHRGLSLWVRRENERAREFYEKVGFGLDAAERVRQHPVLPIEIHEVRYRLSL